MEVIGVEKDLMFTSMKTGIGEQSDIQLIPLGKTSIYLSLHSDLLSDILTKSVYNVKRIGKHKPLSHK